MLLANGLAKLAISLEFFAYFAVVVVLALVAAVVAVVSRRRGSSSLLDLALSVLAPQPQYS